MESSHLSMTADQFKKIPREPGWKYEYYNEKAHITPAEMVAVVELAPSSLPVWIPRPDGIHFERLDEPFDALAEAAYETFEDSMDYCDWPKESIRQNLGKHLEKWAASEDKDVKQSSRIAWSEETGEVAGVLMIQRNKSGTGPKISLVFTSPSYRGNGIATTMLLDAWKILEDELDSPRLRSTYTLGNHQAKRWYKFAGFCEVSSLLVARHRLNIARQNLARFSRYNRIGAAERARYASQVAHYETQVATLEAIQNRGFYDAVSPIVEM